MPFFDENSDKHSPQDKEELSNGKMPIRFIGMSAAPMRDQVEEVKKRVFQGVNKIELGFWGSGKGGGQSTTPGMYGKDSRQAIKEQGIVNNLDFSTHVAPNTYGWAGYSPQQGEFSDAMIENNVREVQRTIEFAQDVTNGGAVVVHTGEWQRSIAGDWGHEGFSSYPGEQNDVPHHLVNRRTGKIMFRATNDQKIWVPQERRDEQGNIRYFKNSDGSYIVDEFGQPVPELALDANNEVILDEFTYADYVQREKQKARDAGEPIPSDTEILKKFHKQQVGVQVDHAIAQARHFGAVYYDSVEGREQAQERLELLRDLQEHLSPKDFEQYIRTNYPREALSKPGDPVKNVFEAMEKSLAQAERGIKYGRETLSQGKRQAAELMDNVDKAEKLEDYGVERSTATIARLGMKCLDSTQQKQKEDPNFKPLYIAPENIYPEQYGSHPQELKTLVLGAREKMEKQLLAKGYDSDEAKELAKEHIKATFDIGHVNTWWKYFDGSQEEFKKWMLEHVQDLVDNDVIGHMHIADNFGYEDEHVTPGQGTTPIKEFVDIMAKNGLTDMITEPAHQDVQALFGSWREFGGSWGVATDMVEAVHASQSGNVRPEMDSWTNLQNSYFGTPTAPTFVVGQYAPSQDFRGAPFYTGVPFE